MFSKDACSSKPDFSKASPVPLAVPSQPPPAPPGITKCNFSIATAEVDSAADITKVDMIFL